MNNKTPQTKQGFNFKLWIALFLIVVFNILCLSLIRFVKIQDYIAIIIVVDVLTTLLLLISMRGFFKKDRAIKQQQTIDFKKALPQNQKIIIEDAISEETFETVTPEASYEASILRPNEIIKANPIYDKYMDMAQYANELSQYFKENGLLISVDTSRTLLSALAASKVLMLSHLNSDIAWYTLDVFTQYIGMKTTKISVESAVSLETLLSFTELSSLLNLSYQYKDRLFMIAIDHIEFNLENELLDSMLAYVSDPSKDMAVYQKQAPDIKVLQPNTWFSTVVKHDQKDNFKTLIPTVIFIDLEASVTEALQTVSEPALKLSMSSFERAIQTALETYLLDETYWKHFDQLEDYLKAYHHITLDNLVMRQIERYTACFQMCDGHLNEALSTILKAKILNQIPNLQEIDDTHKKAFRQAFDEFFERIQMPNPWAKRKGKSEKVGK